MVLCPSQLVERADLQYLSEKSVFEDQLALSASQERENPLVNNNDGPDDSVEGSGLLNNEGSNCEEAPVIETENEGGETTSKNGEGENKEQETEEQQSTEELPSYFSEVEPHLLYVLCSLNIPVLCS